MKHILVAMDISEVSDRAFERALQLAQAHDAKLTVMHVIDHQTLDHDHDPSMDDDLIEQAMMELRQHWANLPEPEAARISLVVKIGTICNDILSEVAARKVDLIVLGLHHANAQDVFVGTKAEHIACSSVVPVLVVKDKPAGSYHTVVSATDFSPCSARALTMGLELAPDADFFLLHVFETPFPGRIKLNAEQLAEYERPLVEELQHEAQKAMDAFLKEHGHCEASVTPTLERNETENGISKIVLEQDADLLVLGIHGKSRIAASVIGSYALDFLNAPPCDVLVSR